MNKRKFLFLNRSAMKRKDQWKWMTTIAIVGVGGLGWYWFANRSSSESDVSRYKTEIVKKGTLIRSISASGNVAIENIANVDPTIAGTVANLSVDVGDAVKKGDFLFAIINDDLSAGVIQSVATLQSSRNAVENSRIALLQAKKDLDQAEDADDKDDDSYDREQKEILRKKIALAEAQLGASQKSLASSEENYLLKVADASKRQVISPIDGTVNEINIKNGDDLANVSSGSSRVTPIIIGDLGTIRAEVSVNEVDIPNVSEGQKAILTFNALPDLTLIGRVEKIDSLGMATQGVVTYDVAIAFDAIDSRIRPNMSVSASIVTGEERDVIVVPSSAVKLGKDGRNIVQLLSPEATTPESKEVSVGVSNDTETIVTSGLSVGDRIVTRTISPTTSSSENGMRMPGFGGGGFR